MMTRFGCFVLSLPQPTEACNDWEGTDLGYLDDFRTLRRESQCLQASIDGYEGWRGIETVRRGIESLRQALSHSEIT